MARAPARTRVTKTQPQETEPDGLWAIALLRIAMELKRPGAASLEEIAESVVSRMGLPKARFEKYLADHLGSLRDAARGKGHAR